MFYIASGHKCDGAFCSNLKVKSLYGKHLPIGLIIRGRDFPFFFGDTAFLLKIFYSNS